ncbi:hypothetical protein [Thalassotalea marina]|uniref:Uncharacterized protein n=1 Tax=Thalassotalea marina TaxID=1673741 RepID=A0A919BL89_9GAMM|nr:hypothetical protein [Thalassotalea marina]GHF97799.1 hypothetical protein GCM10017161_27570 [Thalassotalea marina]
MLLEILLVFAPFVVFVLCAIVGRLLYRVAKKRKALAFVFGVAVQMFLPDPQVEKTIKMIVSEKKLQKSVENEEDK